MGSMKAVAVGQARGANALLAMAKDAETKAAAGKHPPYVETFIGIGRRKLLRVKTGVMPSNPSKPMLDFRKPRRRERA